MDTELHFIYKRINNSNLTTIHGLINCEIYDLEKSEVLNFCSFFGSKPVVYILFNDATKQAYVGQTNNPQQRFRAHIKEKDWWNELLIISAAHFTDSIIRFIEADFIQKSKNVNIYKFENAQNASRPLVSVPDEHIAQQYISEIFKILKIRRFMFFENIKYYSIDTPIENPIENPIEIFSSNIKIVIQPCGNKAKNNYENSILNQVDLSKYDLPINKTSVWGVHKKKYFDNMNIGDNVYFGDMNGLFCCGIITNKLINEKIAMDLWNNSDYKYIYTLSSVKDPNINLLSFNKAVGYDSTARIQSFRIFDSLKSKKFIDSFGEIV